MTGPSLGASAALIKWVATAAKVPAKWARSTYVATLSIAEAGLSLLQAGIVSDVRRLKEAHLARIEAETDAARADALKKQAEAAEAANRADLPKRRDAIARAEQQLAQLQVAKVQAEIDQMQLDAETRRIEAVANGRAKLIEAIAKLRQDGGELMFSQENLEQILRVGLPSPEKTDSVERREIPPTT